MKHNYKSKIALALGALFTMAAANQAMAQCEITGLDETYCLDAPPVFLTGEPGGGTFSGPGVSGDLFYPEDAGVGVHTITYEYIPGGDRYYIKSNIGNPWGQTTNDAAMNTAFGPGEWMLEAFETVDVETVFSGSTSMIFMDGSQNQSTELNTFLIANLAAIEEWVDGGGVILINAAPNEGGDINFGFGGTSLDYPSVFLGSVSATDPGHPVFAGPELPTATTMTGSSYCHGRILGVGLTNVLVSGANVGLAEKDWGAGHAMFGSMTVDFYHNPDPQAANFRANLMAYLDNYVDFPPCITTIDVEVIDEVSPAVVAESDEYEICLGESYTLTGSGAEEFYWGGVIEDGVPNTPGAPGTYSHILTGVSDAGCFGSDVATVVVHPIPFVEAGLDMAQCVGMDVTLEGSGAEMYVWSPAVTDGEPFTVTTEGETTYTVTGTDANGCEDTDEIIVEGVGFPEITAEITGEFVAYGGEIDVTVTGGSGSYAYMWSHGPTTEDVTGLGEGSYMVTVDDVGVEDGVCPEVDSVFMVMSFVGVEDLEENDLMVYPSPAVDNVTIVYAGNFTYELTSINGDVIMTGTAVDQEIVSVVELAAGTYVINVIANDMVTTTKIVKQ